MREDGCIRIDDRHDGQVVKTENSKRTIPIHNKLIDIGFFGLCTETERQTVSAVNFL